MSTTATLLLLGSLLAAGSTGTSKSQKKRSPYQHYLHEACAALEKKQERLQRDFKLSTWDHYEWCQDTRELVFSQRGVPRVIATVQFVGSYSAQSRTWLWAWANQSIVPAMRSDVFRVKDFGEQRGWRPLTEAKWAADEADGWEMTAVTVEVLQALGAYRSPDPNGGRAFLVITGIRWAKPAWAAPDQPCR